MYNKLENIIKELNPSCNVGEYRDRIVELFENENWGGEKVRVENFVIPTTPNKKVLYEIREKIQNISMIFDEFSRYDNFNYANIEDEYSFVTGIWEK